MGKAVNPNWVAGHYRWRNDDGTMATATWLRAEDTAETAMPVDTKFRLRINWGESAGQTTGTSWAPKLQWRLSGGSYADVGSTTAVQYATSGTVADGATETTHRITTAPTGCASSASDATFDSNNSTPSKTPTDDYLELEFCLLLDSAQVSNGQVYEFRLVNSDGSTFDSYDTTPTLTVSEAEPVSLTGDPGALALTGGTATLRQHVRLTATVGSLALTGGTATLDLTLPASAGALALTGADATFDYTAGVSLTGDPGALTLAGGTAATRITLPAESGSLSLSGAAAAWSVALPATGGALALTGGDATLSYTANAWLTAEPGTLTLTGGDAVLAYDRSLAADPGALALSGGSATFRIPGTEQAWPGVVPFMGNFMRDQ